MCIRDSPWVDGPILRPGRALRAPGSRRTRSSIAREASPARPVGGRLAHGTGRPRGAKNLGAPSQGTSACPG
eukprot:7428332-Alexandrium_andersonii.AAC.1